MSNIKYLNKGVCYPRGFQASGLNCGVKDSKEYDLGLILSDVRASVSGCFTLNQFIASPINRSKNVVSKSTGVRAVLVNSGNANACTGKKGDQAVSKTVTKLAENLSIKESEVLTFSTGSIGVELPSKAIVNAYPQLISNLSTNGDDDFSKAILTTDAYEKKKAASIKCKNKVIRIGASAKGAGMIEPSMATMLCYITSDVGISKILQKKLIREVVNDSFNRISVDGDMSTNDSVLFLCNGLSGVEIKTEKDPLYVDLKKSLTHICCDLAQKMAADGEGATKLLRVKVIGAKNDSQAKDICQKISNSLLLKCAMFGSSPNWGRVLSTIGSIRSKIDPKKVKVKLQGQLCFFKGEPTKISKKLISLMKKKNVSIDVDLGLGKSCYHMWGCDLGYDYVRINDH